MPPTLPATFLNLPEVPGLHLTVISVYWILYNSQTCDVEIFSIQVFLLTDCLQVVMTTRITSLSPMLDYFSQNIVAGPARGKAGPDHKNQTKCIMMRLEFSEIGRGKPISLHFTSWRKMNLEHLIVLHALRRMQLCVKATKANISDKPMFKLQNEAPGQDGSRAAEGRIFLPQGRQVNT